MSPKDVQLLTEKKHRQETGLFIVEGDKNIRELLASNFTIKHLFGTRDFLAVVQPRIHSHYTRTQVDFPIDEASEAQLIKMGTFMTNTAGVAVAVQNDPVSIDTLLAQAKTNTVVVLDDVRDPGNLGTIMRIADWYGVSHIIASETTVDCYNPKVVTGSMGSFTRIQVSYYDLETILKEATALQLPVIAADMEGINLHETHLPQNGLLIMGSESHGVSDVSLTYTTNKVTIPRFGSAESLNVGVATAIFLDGIRRG